MLSTSLKVLVLQIAVVVVILASCVSSAPLENYTTTYDQKQTGEYNIQLHLKDFQIIAVLADEQLDGFGVRMIYF